MSQEKRPLHQVILSQNTLVPIGVILVIAGAIIWLTTMFNSVSRHSEDISQIMTRLDAVETKAVDMQDLQTRVGVLETNNAGMIDRMARIETKLDLLISNIP